MSTLDEILADIPEINPLRERACTGHMQHESIPTTRVRVGRIVYIDLRCPVCERPRGLRRVPRAELLS